MNQDVRNRYHTFLKVRDFGLTHRQQFPATSPGGKAFAALAAAIAQIEVQSTAKVAAGDGRKAKEAARRGLERRLLLVARIARFVGRTMPAGDDAFELPPQRSGAALVAAARAFLDQDDALVRRLTPFGLPRTIGKELRDLVERYEEADRLRRAGNAERAAARAGVKAAIAQGAEAVRTLEVVVPSTFADDPMPLAAWKEARQAHARRRTATNVVPPAPPPPGPPTPEPPPNPAPADHASGTAAPGTTLPKAS